MRWVLRAGMCAAVALEALVQGLEISNIVAVAPASSYMGGAVLNALKCTSQERRDLSVRALVANDADVVRCRQNCCGVIVGGGVASTLCDVSFPSLSTSAVGDHVLGDKTCFSTPPQRIKALAESLVGCDSLVVVKETHSTILELPRGDRVVSAPTRWSSDFITTHCRSLELIDAAVEAGVRKVILQSAFVAGEGLARKIVETRAGGPAVLDAMRALESHLEETGLEYAVVRAPPLAVSLADRDVGTGAPVATYVGLAGRLVHAALEQPSSRGRGAYHQVLR